MKTFKDSECINSLEYCVAALKCHNDLKAVHIKSSCYDFVELIISCCILECIDIVYCYLELILLPQMFMNHFVDLWYVLFFNEILLNKLLSKDIYKNNIY